MQTPQYQPTSYGQDMSPLPLGQQDLLFGTTGDMAKMLDKLLEDDLIKKHLKDSTLWAFLTKNFMLTFFNDVDSEVLRHRYAEAKISFRNSIPEHKWDDKYRILMYNLDILFESNLSRARGMTQGRLNERTMLATHLKHQTSVIAEESGRRGGVIRGLGRLIGRG
jgi:hypothetical protein